MASDEAVQAAGAVVLRQKKSGKTQVLIVHRPRYDDWSLPKGKLDPGENFEDAAVRELLEETGVTGRLLTELPDTQYCDRTGRAKHVRWWVMQPTAKAERPPDKEIDEVRWVGIEKGLRRLSYDSDRDLVTAALNGCAGRTSLLVVRHTMAGERRQWRGDDRSRPLSKRGWRQAEAMVDQLAPYAVTRIISSPYVRCVQTVEPLAAARGLEVEIDERLAEGKSLKKTLKLVKSLDSGTVVCSHGDVIGNLLTHVLPDRKLEWQKGSTWALTLDGQPRAVAARYLEPPD